MQRYVYPHAHVRAGIFSRVYAWRGEPRGRDGQSHRVASSGRVRRGAAAAGQSRSCCARSLLPPVYAISMAEELGAVEFLSARASRSRARPAADPIAREVVAATASRAPCRSRCLPHRATARRARVAQRRGRELARRLGCEGVHWSAARLGGGAGASDDMLCAASCHDAGGARTRRASSGVDFVVLGPVKATPSHPDASPLGWARFAELVHGTPIPVYALGGLHRDDLGRARLPTVRMASRCAAQRGQEGTSPPSADLRIVGIFDDRHPIGFCRPCAEVDHLAALGTEWAGRTLRPHSTGLPHCGHAATRTLVMAVGRARVQARAGDVQRRCVRRRHESDVGN